MSIAIVIVDDHPVIRHGLGSILSKEDNFVIAGQAEDGERALAVITAVQPDVVILDITLEGIDGISLISRIKEMSAGTSIIMYTMHGNKNYISRALKAGALGYVLKSDPIGEVTAAVYSALNRTLYLSTGLPPAILGELLASTTSSEKSTAELTPREYEIASLIAQGQNPDQVGQALFISPKTVRVHRTKIMHKLGCSNIHELLLELRQHFPQ
ncbi:response regulator transcription factor [Desulfogranum mediterraneum]|uniref:response regulator transcription factor n=1 Tax=Desulfogranum mediterraneum TaxID=160661 RepID=UPI001376C857|nr:response regulator transcription factor [Desulfogranum mediterraneum]